MLQLIGIALSGLFCYIILRDKAPQFAVIISIVTVLLICSIGIKEFKELTNSLSEIVASIPSTASYVKLMIKVLLIVILTQITTDICRDNGENSIASGIEVTAKTVVISMVLPLFKTALELILGLIKWKKLFCFC